MKVLVIHHSKYGCGEKIAGGIAKGLQKGGHTADVIQVKDLGSKDPKNYDFFVIGSPTHAGGPTFKVGGAIKTLGKKCKGKSYTSFTTWMDVDQKTLEKMDKTAKKSGLEKMIEGRAYKVKGMKGPLQEGSMKEAEKFGEEIGKKLTE